MRALLHDVAVAEITEPYVPSITTGNNAETEEYNLLNANFSYNILPAIRLFVKGENLLGEKYQTYKGFYMPKATFMGGICIEL